MFELKPIARHVLVALSGVTAAVVSSGALAQQAQQPQQLERVEITGSAIRRVDAETAVPVTVIKVEDLKEQGVTSVEQILQTLAPVQTQVSVSQTVGASYGGATFANMRGLGSNKTLVLLNGRRVANNAFDSTAPDMNMIPFAALERVEVLRDGASSLYGTDAIGGVINFITRRDFQGGTITAGYDKPQKSGGQTKNFNAGYGYGDLAKQKFNIWGFIDYQKQDRISGTDRTYNDRLPGGLSGSPIPANYYQTGSVVGNPAAPSCAGALYGLAAGDDSSCYIATAKFVDYVPQSERKSGMLKATFAFNPENQGGVEYFYSESNVQTRIAPVPYGLLYQNPTMPNGQANPYYPGGSGNPGVTWPFIPDPTWQGSKVGTKYGPNGTLIQPGYVALKWRDLFNGSRGDENVNTQQRLLGFLEGTVGGWDYKAGATWNENKVDEKLISGYNNGGMIQAGVLEGIINPFSMTQTPDALAYINSASEYGTLMSGKGTTTGVDVRGSRDLQDWFKAGRPVALALGAEYRREDFHQYAHADYAAAVVASTGVDPATNNEGTRNIYALYAELAMPILKTLDVTAAVRYDKYSDFGSTTNPKFSFRWQPSQQLLMRGAYSTGFRAPSLYELNAAQSYTNTPQVNDPVTCPNGVPTGASINNCNAQFQTLFGGNQSLQPEKSKSWTFGFILEPTKQVNLGVDFWWVRLTNQIAAGIATPTLYDPANYAIFQQYFHRDPTGHLSTDGTSCPGADCGYTDQRNQNLGGLNENGMDLSAAYRLQTGYGAFNLSYNGTYIAKYEYQDYQSGPWNQNVGAFVGAGAIFRWQHNLAATWNYSAYTIGTAFYYKTGYADQYPQDNPEGVSPYATVDLYGTWMPTKTLSLTLGVRNLFDREPPYSNQDYVFQANYDPRYSDPTGRTYYIRGTYRF